VERFTSADCATCWQDPATPGARAGELALDWIVPGAEDAPLAAAARREALSRLELLRRPRPAPTDTVRTPRTGGDVQLRVAQGLPFGGYIGTSIELKRPRPGAWKAWLALVEQLPAGAEGSPVERLMVRNVLQVDWPPGSPRQREARPMNVPEGADPRRLRLVGWLEDARGAIRAISRTVCAPQAVQR
jgi:hypothetical protein